MISPTAQAVPDHSLDADDLALAEVLMAVPRGKAAMLQIGSSHRARA